MSRRTDAPGLPAGARATLALTRRSGGWAAVSIAVLFAALNTANNLLYLLFAILAAAPLVSAVVARRALRRLEGTLLVPAEVRAGTASLAAVRLSCAPGRPGVPGLTVALENHVAGVPWLAPGETPLTLSLPVELGRRGVRRLRLEARCAYPFDLVEARRVLEDVEVLVLPASLPAGAEPTATGGRTGPAPTRQRGAGEELLDIRDWRAGDDARSIDWKATARIERPMVREHERELDRRVALVVDGAVPEGPRAQAEEVAERAISRAAGAAEALAAEGWRVRLVTPAGQAGGAAHDVLRALARLDLTEGALPPKWWAPRLESDEACLVFSGREQARP